MVLRYSHIFPIYRYIRPAWSSLEQGKTLQHFLLDRDSKIYNFCILNRVRAS